MADFDDINTGKYHIFDTVFIMHVHVVSVTKCRHQVFRSGHLERMEQIMRDGCPDSGCN